jgi:CubicO group peptidase (beta-lactamase class C family)
VVKDWGVTQLVTADREITTHDLLTMTAGMTNTWWHRVFEPSVYGVVPQLLKDAGVYDDMGGAPTTLEENIKKLASVPLIASPGTMFDYSNNSVDTLCRLVEVVSGLDFDTYQRRNVLEPLRMDETWFYIPEDQRHRLAAVYEPGRDEKVTEAAPLGLGMLGPGGALSPHHTYFSGAAGLHGTTADYFRFAQMLLNKGELDGVRVLSPASVRLMTTNQIGDLTNWQLTQNKWGYQVDIQQGENAPAGSIHYLGGPGAYSWQGFFSTKFVNNPRLDTVIMTMSTPGFDGALPHNLRMVAAATAAVTD